MSFGIGANEYGVDLLAGHKSEDRFGRLLLGYGKNPVTNGDELDASGLPKHETHERSDRGQPQVARAGSVAAGRLQVIEEGQDSRRAYGVEGQLIDRTAMLPGEKR